MSCCSFIYSYIYLTNFIELLLDMVIGSRAEALHDAQSDAAQVGGTHVVVDAGDAPCVTFLAVGHEE